MKWSHVSAALGFTGIAVVAACSGSGGSVNDGSAVTASGSSSSSSSGGTQSRPYRACAVGTCSDSAPYNTCLETQCGSTYKECWGADYKTGTYSGPCADVVSCQQACACGDTACLRACPGPSDNCGACLFGLAGCVPKCTAPSCASQSASSSSGSTASDGGTRSDAGDAGGTTHSCADVSACCNAQTNNTYKSACLFALSQAHGDESLCNQGYNQFSAYGITCP